MTDSFAFYITLLRKQFTKYCSERLNEIGVSYGQLYIIIYIGKKGHVRLVKSRRL